MNVALLKFCALSQSFYKKRREGILLVIVGLTFIVTGSMVALPRSRTIPTVHAASSGDWPTYMHDIKRSGDSKAETIINSTSASTLKVHWTAQSGGTIFSQPIVANGTIYWGSFDGYE